MKTSKSYSWCFSFPWCLEIWSWAFEDQDLTSTIAPWSHTGVACLTWALVLTHSGLPSCKGFCWLDPLVGSLVWAIHLHLYRENKIGSNARISGSWSGGSREVKAFCLIRKRSPRGNCSQARPSHISHHSQERVPWTPSSTWEFHYEKNAGIPLSLRTEYEG